MTRRLPPFFSLRALEAAARHRSYSRAGEELGVTQGAVSQQIRRLEEELGARLFERRGNAMIPTPDAARLGAEIGRGLNVMRNGVAEFAAAAERDPLVMSVDPQFGSRWLPARLPLLLAHPAGANLEIRVEERYADFVTDGVDVAVRYGAGRWDGVQAVHLLSETLDPVCSPALADELGATTAAELSRAPLLHHSHRPWSLWFAQFGLEAPPPSALVFDDSLILIEAAAQGLGVALGRSALTESDLRSGRLVRLLDAPVASDRSFFLVWRADSRKIHRIAAVHRWLVDHIRNEGPGGPAG